MQAFIYILHFDVPLSHAQHYAGCTQNIRARLARHAHGAGSNLTRVLKERGIPWRLGHLATCSHAEMRRIERRLKDQNNTPRICDICNGDRTIKIGATTPISLDAINWPTTSECIQLLTRELDKPPIICVRFTSADEPPATLTWIKSVMHNDKDAVGFIPVGGEGGLNSTHDRGLIAIVSNNGQDVGYAAFTLQPDGNQVNIHQCVIMDDARLCGHGRALVEHVASTFAMSSIVAKVRDDLAANHFWQSIGFKPERTFRHKTSGSKINWYELKAKEAF